VVGPPEVATQHDGGGGDFDQARKFTTSTLGLVAAATMNDSVYKWDEDTPDWVAWGAIGGSASPVVGLAWDGITAYVAGDETRKVTTSSSSQLVAGYGPALVLYNDSLYGIANGDQSRIDKTTGALTQIGDQSGGVRGVSTSDKGPIWTTTDGYLYEYNEGDDVIKRLGQVVPAPTESVYPAAPVFYRGLYLVPFYYLLGDVYLWTFAGIEGVQGPIRNPGATNTNVASVGVVGDRFLFTAFSALWAYDLSSGAIAHLAAVSTDDSYQLGGAIPDGITYIDNAFVPHVTSGGTQKVNWFDLGAYTTSQTYLSTGRYHHGYLGLNKALTKVTVNTETALGSGDSIGLEYSLDGGSYVAVSGTMGSGETSHTWIVSSSSSTVRGVEVEYKLKVTSGSSATSPKVVSLTSESVGSEDRLEWVMAVDVGESQVQDGRTVLAALNSLKTDHDVVEFTDPWQKADTDSPDTFDVTVEEVQLPAEQDDGLPVAVVRVRAVSTV